VRLAPGGPAAGPGAAPPPDAERWLFDFGVNIAGFANVSVAGAVPAGQESYLLMRHAETAGPDGTVNRYCGHPCNETDATINVANQTNKWTLATRVAAQAFAPFSAYAGFRFVEVA
jgi:hypothetical protein